MAAGERRRKRTVSSGPSEAGHVEFTRRVYENSKVTIPKEIRELHDIQEGDFVVLKVVKVVRSERVGGIEPGTVPPVAESEVIHPARAASLQAESAATRGEYPSASLSPLEPQERPRSSAEVDKA
jgi:AbrB family looped-hinge helix DNA binding protein